MKQYEIPEKYYFRLHHVRPRFKSDVENVLFYVAKKLVNIGELPTAEFAERINAEIIKYPGNAQREIKTINNWRTEISALFGFIEHTALTDKPGLRAVELAKYQDLIGSFRVWLYTFQYPGAHIKPQSILEQIEMGIHFKPAQYILMVLRHANRNNGNAIGLTKAEVCHCIFNDLRVTRDKEGPEQTWKRIAENRANDVTYDFSGDVIRYAGDIIDYMALAGLLRSYDGKTFVLNLAESEIIDQFCESASWYSGYDRMLERRSGTLSAIKDCSNGWFSYVNRPITDVSFGGAASPDKYTNTNDTSTETMPANGNAFSLRTKVFPKKPESLLLDNMYSLKEITKVVKSTFPDEHDVIGTVRSWGYVVRDPFVFKGFSHPRDYFKAEFAQPDIFASSPYMLRFDNNPLIKLTLESLEKDYDIIEFEENQYISIRRLTKFGLSKQSIKSFCQAVHKRMASRRFFTATNAYNECMDCGIEDMGFGTLFYDSLLRHSNLFNVGYWNRTAIYSAQDVIINASSFLIEYMNAVGRITVDEFIRNMQDDYGITLTRSIVLSRIKDTPIFHDQILDYLYRDYDTYFGDV